METQAPRAEPEFLTAQEAADLARVSLQTIYQKVRQGVIPGRQMGGRNSRYVIPRASLLRYLEGDGSQEKGGGDR